MEDNLTISQRGKTVIITDSDGEIYDYVQDADSLVGFLWHLMGDGMLVNTGITIGYEEDPLDFFEGEW